MTNQTDSDYLPANHGKNFSLPGVSSGADLAGIRVTRAEFSRMMGVTRQACTDWVKAGRIVVGADGRFDPRQAIASLLRTGDPARIRSAILAPLVKDIAGRDREIERLRQENETLRAAVAAAEENADFEEQSSFEILGIIDQLTKMFSNQLDDLEAIGVTETLNMIIRWIDAAIEKHDEAGTLLDHYRAPVVEDDYPLPCAAVEQGEGAGNSCEGVFHE